MKMRKTERALFESKNLNHEARVRFVQFKTGLEKAAVEYMVEVAEMKTRKGGQRD